MLVCLYVRLVASNFVVFTVELTVVADDKPMADDTSVKFTSSLELDVRKMCYCRDVSLDIVQEALLMLKEAGITIKKAKEARGTCFFVFADKKKIGRAKTKADAPVVVAKYRDKLKKQLESGDSHLPVTFTSLPVPLGPDLRCSAAAADAATRSCVSTLTISCMCKLAHATCVIICDAVDEASGLGEAVEDGEAAGGSSRETRRDPVLQPKPVASSSRRRFEENYDDVMRSCETGENATH